VNRWLDIPVRIGSVDKCDKCGSGIDRRTKFFREHLQVAEEVAEAMSVVADAYNVRSATPVRSSFRDTRKRCSQESKRLRATSTSSAEKRRRRIAFLGQ
jgi:DNA-directed RNA polymerase subunit M/transcription elongation factor TFIIS